MFAPQIKIVLGLIDTTDLGLEGNAHDNNGFKNTAFCCFHLFGSSLTHFTDANGIVDRSPLEHIYIFNWQNFSSILNGSCFHDYDDDDNVA